MAEEDLVFWSLGNVSPWFGASVNSVLTSRALRSITVKCGRVGKAVATRDGNELLLKIIHESSSSLWTSHMIVFCVDDSFLKSFLQRSSFLTEYKKWDYLLFNCNFIWKLWKFIIEYFITYKFPVRPAYRIVSR